MAFRIFWVQDTSFAKGFRDNTDDAVQAALEIPQGHSQVPGSAKGGIIICRAVEGT